MKTVVITLVLLLMALPLRAGGLMMIGGGTPAADGASCQASSFQGSLTYDNEWDYSIADAAGAYYRALKFTAGASKSVCKIEIVMNVAAGNVSAKNYTARLWTLSGENLNVELGASTAVTGVTGGPTTYTFTFSTPVSITASTAYGLTVSTGSTDGSNYASWAGNTGAISNWALDRCESSKECNGAYEATDLAARLFAYE